MERRSFFRLGAAAGLATLARPTAGLALAEPPIRRAGPLRLNSNENPLGLSPAAREAVLEGMAEANRYPFSAVGPLREAIAGRHGTTTAHVLLGNGSTEILRVAVAAFGGAEGLLLTAHPTFEDVGDYARPFPFRIERLPLTAAFGHDLPAMRERAERAPGPVVVYLCNPNNPTGTLTDCAEIDAWIAAAPERVFFVVDEAYFDFVDDTRYWSFDRVAVTRPNVLVVRTFSKIYGMAGLRAGYGIASPETIRRLAGYITQTSPNHLAQVAALASLQDRDLVNRGRALNARARQTLLDALDALGLDHLPSHTNFVMHRITGALRAYQQRMRERDILVGRAFPPMLDYNRVSIGLPAEMEEFVAVLREFRERGWV